MHYSQLGSDQFIIFKAFKMEIPFDKIKPCISIVIIMIVNVIVTGFAFIFFYKRQLFLDLDIFRLSVLSLGVSLPVYIYLIAAHLRWPLLPIRMLESQYRLLVENSGVEPLTSCMPCKRSTN